MSTKRTRIGNKTGKRTMGQCKARKKKKQNRLSQQQRNVLKIYATVNIESFKLASETADRCLVSNPPKWEKKKKKASTMMTEIRNCSVRTVSQQQQGDTTCSVHLHAYCAEQIFYRAGEFSVGHWFFFFLRGIPISSWLHHLCSRGGKFLCKCLALTLMLKKQAKVLLHFVGKWEGIVNEFIRLRLSNICSHLIAFTYCPLIPRLFRF